MVLNEDLRRLDDSLYKGQLGWTVAEPGYSLMNGNVAIGIEFDTGIQARVSVFWVDFVREECADEVRAKIVESYRNSPFDADIEVANRWVPEVTKAIHNYLGQKGIFVIPELPAPASAAATSPAVYGPPAIIWTGRL